MYSKKETVKVLLYELHAHPKNPKKHKEELIEKSINDLGYAENIVVDENNIILAGHGRVNALKKLKGVKGGGEEVEVIRITGWTEEEKEKYLLLANQSTMLAGFDDIKLKEFDAETLDYAGLDSDILIEPEERDDVVPEEPVDPQTKLGDLYELGNHRLLCGDSTEYQAASRLMENRKADMVFTDPPYNINYKGQGKNTSTTIMADNMEDDAFRLFLTKVFNNHAEFTKSGGGVYIFHSPKTQDSFAEALDKAGYEIKYQLIWNKPHAGMGMGDYRWKHEPFFYCGKKGEKIQFYGDRTNTSVWDFQKSEQDLLAWAKRQKRLELQGKTTIWTMKRENVQDYVHPTQKPVELITYAIHNSTKSEDVILDLFLGSGSTLIAAEKTGRVCYAMELDPKYCDVAIQRWVDYTGIESITKNGNPIIWNKTQQPTTTE